MLRTSPRRGLITGTALLVGLTGLAIGQGAADAAAPLPVSQAGPVVTWGAGTPPSPTADQASEAFTKVVANMQTSAIGLTAAGKVELIGTNPFPSYGYTHDAIPDDLATKTVIDIAGDATYGNGIAVTDAGQVYTWNLGNEGWASSMPPASQLQGSKAATIAADGAQAAVVKQNGSVLVWGNTAITGDYGQASPPANLTGVTSVFFSGDGKAVYAVKSDGTVVAWGDNGLGQTDLPGVVTNAGDDTNVTDIASVGPSAVALLSDGTLAAWGSPGDSGANQPPAATADKDIVALAANSNVYFAVDSTGDVYEWGSGAATAAPALAQLPAGVDPANITGLSANDYYVAAIQATYGYVTKPTIAGTPTVGQTLTATHATFTAEPDEAAAGQWLADSKPIAGATGTTYTLTANEVGKAITYSETAQRGTETATAISEPTAKVTAASNGGSNTQPQPQPAPPVAVQTPAQKKLAADQAKLKKLKKQYKKAHGHKKSVLKKKIAKLKKTIKKDKKQVKAGK